MILLANVVTRTHNVNNQTYTQSTTALEITPYLTTCTKYCNTTVYHAEQISEVTLQDPGEREGNRTRFHINFPDYVQIRKPTKVVV